VEERGVAQGVGPQREVHCCGSASTSVQQLLAHSLGEVADAALGNALLEMGVDAAKGELSAHVVTCLFEGVVGALPVVAMVM
jgi:hypothetical protein